MGDEALLALGEAGDLEVAAHGRVAVSATAPVVAAILSAVGAERLKDVHLVASAPNVRRAAAREIGRRGSLDAAPALIARLDDPDDGVRRTALDSLRLLAAPHDAGLVAPSPDGTGSPRGEAARWRDWWAREGSLLAAAPQAR